MKHTNFSNTKATNLIPISAIVVVSVYIAAQLLSDIGSLKIAWIAGFSVDAGTFIYPLTFTIRDLIHKQLGKTVARTVILLAAVINLFMVVFFSICRLAAAGPILGTGQGICDHFGTGVADCNRQYYCRSGQ